MNSCVFCQIISKKIPAETVYEDDLLVAFLDKYPQTRGHLQLVPKTHYRWVYELPHIGTFFETAQKIIRGIIPVLGADHVTIATFGHQIEHAHVWVVPQYNKKVQLEENIREKGTDMAHIAHDMKVALQKLPVI